jgi:flagellar biosynthesis component FlhA
MSLSVYNVVKHNADFSIVLKQIKKVSEKETVSERIEKVKSFKTVKKAKTVKTAAKTTKDPKKVMKKVFVDLRKTVRENNRYAKETAKVKRVTIRLNKIVFKELIANAKKAKKVAEMNKKKERKHNQMMKFCDKVYEDNFVLTEFGDSEFEINLKPTKKSTKKWVKKQGK